VRRRRGDIKPGILAAQVYWLSEMHVGSTQTIRLPITTYYPDKAAEKALEGLLPTGLQIGCKVALLNFYVFNYYCLRSGFLQQQGCLGRSLFAQPLLAGNSRPVAVTFAVNPR